MVMMQQQNWGTHAAPLLVHFFDCRARSGLKHPRVPHTFV